MIILALDTTGPHCSVALWRDGRVLADISERIGRGHAERLGVMVEDALASTAIAPSGIDRIAVCRGPGSFTGLRVGLAFALGFALPHGTPVLGLSSPHIAASTVPGRVAVRIDVRRGELGWAGFEGGRALVPFTVAPVDTVEAALADFAPGSLLTDPVPSMPAAAALAARLDPADYPPVPLYSRAPDAKLPGGLAPA